MAKQLLLVEDDKDVAQALIEYLTAEGFCITHVATLAEASDLHVSAYDVVILDWMLPDGAGIDLLRSWRERGERTPVIVLTARAELVDRVVGLELGANDYITKPFEARELLARIRVQLRTQNAGKPSEVPLRVGALELRHSSHEVRYNGERLELCRQEYALLKLLCENPNHVFSREEILNQAWGYENYPSTRTIDTHVLQLRQKTDPRLIETVRGIGYRLVDL